MKANYMEDNIVNKEKKSVIANSDNGLICRLWGQLIQTLEISVKIAVRVLQAENWGVRAGRSSSCRLF